tara:strand:- start:416 stop:1045 length:630 start_codon:yes stop_codon:yes gene_type:complete
MVRKSKMSLTFCKILIFVCIAVILYSLLRSFLFSSREELDNSGLTDFVTGTGHAVENKSYLETILDKPVNIISVPYTQSLGVDCSAGLDKCRLSTTGNSKENKDKWVIKKSGTWHSITNVTYNKPLGSVYCTAQQKAAGDICTAALWGNPTEQSWEIININDDIFQIKNFSGNNIAMTDCWSGVDKCSIKMNGNSEEVKWRIVLANNES